MARGAVPLHVVDEFLGSAAAEQLYQRLHELPGIPHGMFCVDTRALVDDDVLSDYFAVDVASALVRHLRDLTAIVYPSASAPQPSAIELWIMRLEATMAATGDDAEPFVFPHVDSHGGPVNPTLRPTPRAASILYVGASPASGGTYICLERPLPDVLAAHDRTLMTFGNALALSGQWVRVPRLGGRVVVFDGALMHFVEPLRGFVQGLPRITVLANFWDARPPYGESMRGTCRLEPEQFAVFCKTGDVGGPGFERAVSALSPTERALLPSMLAGIGTLPGRGM